MGQRNNNKSSAASTPQMGNKNRSHLRRNQQKSQTRHAQYSDPNLILGPSTRERRSKLRRDESSKAPNPHTTSGKKKTRQAHMQHNNIMAQHRKTATETTKSLTVRRLDILVDIVFIAALLIAIHLLSYKFMASLFHELWNDQDKSSTSRTVAVSPIELEPPNNAITSTIVKYANMASYPFLIFVPSLIMLSVAIISATMGDADGRTNDQVHTTSTEKMNGRNRVLKLMSICTSGLFIFLSAMIACADTSMWILIGVISVVTPAILMLLARLSMVYAGTSNGYAEPNPARCNDELSSWKGLQRHVSTAVNLLGFVFASLPFLAGFVYIVSPPYLLAAPLSSLTTSSLTGLFIFGVIPLVISMLCVIIRMEMTYWMLKKCFKICGWFVNRNFLVLLFLVGILLFMSILDVRVPSYL